MLVPVQFPSDLVVADHGEIKKRNLEPRIERRALAVHGIEMPVNIFVFEIVATEIATAAVKSELEMLVTQQAKTMAANFISLAHNLGRFIGKMFAHQLVDLAVQAI